VILLDFKYSYDIYNFSDKTKTFLLNYSYS